MMKKEKEETRNGMTFEEMLEAFEKGYGISSVEDMLELAGVDPKELYGE